MHRAYVAKLSRFPPAFQIRELKKEHDTVVRDLQKRHRDDIVALKNEYEEKIRQLEATAREREEELERVKHWESDSEDDDRISSRRSNLDGSFSRKSSRWDRRTPLQLPPLRSGYTTPLPPPTPLKTMDSSPFPSRLNTPKRNGSVTPLFNDMSPLMASGPTSPQPLSPLPDVVMVSKDTPGSLGKKKSDQLSRQSTKLSDKQSSSDSMKAPTPKQPSRAKSNLETVQEVPFDEKIPLEDEERWSNLPTEKLRGGFKQFRTESLLLVTSLQNEIKTQKEDTTKRYNKLKSQYKDHQKKWDAERQVLTDQVDQSQRLQAEAEKEADEAMMQLEAFIADHEKQPKEQPQEQAEKQAAEDQESKKELKKLTPEQREMLNLGNNSDAKTPETKAATDKATGAPSEVPTEEDSRPQTPSSQIDLVNKLKAQMEERRAERQSRATSMHGSLLSAKSRTETATTDDAPFPEDEEAGGDAEVELIDTATSPMTIRSAASSKKSVSIVDHPVVQEYLNTYQVVQDFKEKLVKILQDKELMSHATRLEDIPIVEFDPDRMVHVQVSEMKENTERALREISDILSTLIENEMDPRVSSLSRGLTAQTITTQQSQPTVLETEPEVQREASNVTFETEAIVKELQEALEKLKEEQKKEKKVYEEQLNHNAVVMMEMQDMITELQRELAVAGSTARYGSTLASREQDPPIMFSSLDSERNQKALKKGLQSNKVTAESYKKAVDAMESYVDLPGQRLVHLVKKYSHHVQMKNIEEHVRQSQSLDDDVFHLLDKMEALQNARAQRWNEKMDEMGEERMRLAHILMDTLTLIEEESGIFLIKPIYSWKGKGYTAKYTGKISQNYRPPKMASRAYTPMAIRDGTPMNPVPAPTPASVHASRFTRPPTQGTFDGADIPEEYDDEVPMQGLSVTVGPSEQPMWAMTTSHVKPGSEQSKHISNMITTPRLLELDVNRMLIGQNTISASIKPVSTDDRLVMASNTNLRSYMTIARPSANPSPNAPKRPHSTPGLLLEMQTAAPPSTPYVNPHSSGAGSRLRAKSAEGFNQAQPLPPIKVPSSEDAFGTAPPQKTKQKSSGGSGKSRSVTVTSPRDTHSANRRPSPPRTPPGSSIRRSASPDQTPIPPDTPVGMVTKVVTRSPSQSTTHSLTPVQAET